MAADDETLHRFLETFNKDEHKPEEASKQVRLIGESFWRHFSSQPIPPLRGVRHNWDHHMWCSVGAKPTSSIYDLRRQPCIIAL